MYVSPQEVEADLDFCSNRIGEQARTISIGVLAIVWLFLAGGEKAPILPTKVDVNTLLLAGGSALLSLVSDYFQYLFGYLDSRRVLKEAEARNTAKAQYDYRALTYRLRRAFFWCKQVAVIAAVVALLLAITRALFCF